MQAFKDNYKEIGPAEVAAFGGNAPPDVELAASILPSNISADAATNAIESRLYGEVDTRVNRYDIHVIGPAPFHVVIRNIARVEETGRVTRSSNFGAYSSYYFLYWAAAQNHTGSDVTVRSQAASRPHPYALRELSDDSDVFAAKIDLIPTRATTDWSAFPAADAGETVTLTTAGGYTAAGYSGLKVKRLSGDAPDIRSGEVVVETVPDFSRTIPRLPVNERDFVTVNHPDGSETLRVETTGPSFSRFSVIFNEHLDAGTVQASDFEVNDATPQSADVFNVTVRDDNFQTYAQSPNDPPTGSDNDDDDPDTGDGNKAIAGDSVQDEGEKRGYVFLAVNAMTSNAKPKVELVDDVEDIAGNRRSAGAISAATDRIGPTLAVSFSGGDRPVTNKDVTLTVTSDEDIGSPEVRYARVKSTKVEDVDSVQPRRHGSRRVRPGDNGRGRGGQPQRHRPQGNDQDNRAQAVQSDAEPGLEPGVPPRPAG